MNPKFYYSSESEKCKEVSGRWKRRRNGVTVLRLVVFAFLIWDVYGMVAFDPQLWLWVLLGTLAVFVGLGVLDGRVVRRIRYYEELLRCCGTESGYLAGDFGDLPTGGEFADPKHAYSADMDIFGEDSLFSRLNRTVTLNGRRLLAGWLLSPCRDMEKIRQRQAAVSELAGKPEWCLDFRATGAVGQSENAEDQNEKRVESLLKEPKMFGSVGWKWGCYVLNGLTLAAWAAAIGGWLPYQPAIVLSLMQLGIAGAYAKRVNGMQRRLGDFIRALGSYTGLVRLLTAANFGKERLWEIRAVLTATDNDALRAFGELDKIQNGLDQRANIFAALIMNGLYMRDIHLVMRLERWRDRYGTQVGEWLSAVAEADVLVSMATFRFNHPEYIVPEITNEVLLESEGLGHPFLGVEAMVTNDFAVRDLHDLYIVTGANMAGKSTFLRTVGVNLVLALSGNVVCAGRFRCRPMAVFTSMRTTDDLSKGTSYFHAELLRLQELVQMAEREDRLFIILDEMLKGTNSQDKLNGSLRFLEKLLAYPVAGLVATHDLALGELEQQFPSHFRNVCFEIDHTADDIVYDYKLHPGVSRNMNATILLQKMGLI